MSNDIRIKKSVDAAISTTNWMGMSWEEVDKYLSYDYDQAPFPSTVNSVKNFNRQRKVYVHSIRRSRTYVRFKTTSGTKFFKRAGDAPISGKPLEYPCCRHMGNNNNSDYGTVLDIDLCYRMSAAVGKTMSPLLNSMLPNSRCCVKGLGLGVSLMERFIVTADEIKLFTNMLNTCRIDLSRFPKLRQLHAGLVSFRGRGFTRFMTVLANLLLSLRSHTGDSALIAIAYLLRVEEAYSTDPTSDIDRDEFDIGSQDKSSCRGLVIVAPSGTGKTMFYRGFPCGILDLMNLSDAYKEESPHIIRALSNRGISVLTHSHNFSLWNCPTVFIKPGAVSRGIKTVDHLTPELMALEAAKRADILSHVRELKFRETFKTYYRDIEKHCLVIQLAANQCLLHGIGVLFDHLMVE